MIVRTPSSAPTTSTHHRRFALARAGIAALALAQLSAAAAQLALPTSTASASGLEGIYFVENSVLVGQNAIRRMDLDGSNPVTLFSPGPNSPVLRDLAVDPDAGYVFWIYGGFAGSEIRRSALDGSGEIHFFNPKCGVVIGDGVDIELDPFERRVYFTDAFAGLVAHWGYDVECPELLVIGQEFGNGPRAFDLDPAQGFGVVALPSSLVEVPLTNPAVQNLLSDGTRALQVAIDPVRRLVYYAPAGTGDLLRIRLDGTHERFVRNAATINGISDIEVDSATGRVYWVDWQAGAIRTAPTKGGSFVTLYSQPAVTGPTVRGIDVVSQPKSAASMRAKSW